MKFDLFLLFLFCSDSIPLVYVYAQSKDKDDMF